MKDIEEKLSAVSAALIELVEDAMAEIPCGNGATLQKLREKKDSLQEKYQSCL